MTTATALILGASLLLLGGHYLIRHAVLLATRLKLTPFVIGLTIVAFGTSAPELVVSLDAVLTGHDDIVIGNIIGGNIANILLVLSISALICPIPVPATIIRREGLALIIATLLFMALCGDTGLALGDGAILLSGLLAFNAYCLLRPNETPALPADSQAMPRTGPALHALWIIGALLALALGSHLFVEGAVRLSRLLGVSEGVIGLTVVATGTAAPEIVTAAFAAWRRQSGIAIGNVLGSNIFNMLGIGGVTALVAPVTVHPDFIEVHFAVLLVATTGIVLYGHLQPVLGRAVGGAFFVAYVGYVVSLF